VVGAAWWWSKWYGGRGGVTRHGGTCGDGGDRNVELVKKKKKRPVDTSSFGCVTEWSVRNPKGI